MERAERIAAAAAPSAFSGCGSWGMSGSDGSVVPDVNLANSSRGAVTIGGARRCQAAKNCIHFRSDEGIRLYFPLLAAKTLSTRNQIYIESSRIRAAIAGGNAKGGEPFFHHAIIAPKYQLQIALQSASFAALSYPSRDLPMHRAAAGAATLAGGELCPAEPGAFLAHRVACLGMQRPEPSAVWQVPVFCMRPVFRMWFVFRMRSVFRRSPSPAHALLSPWPCGVQAIRQFT